MYILEYECEHHHYSKWLICHIFLVILLFYRSEFEKKMKQVLQEAEQLGSWLFNKGCAVKWAK